MNVFLYQNLHRSALMKKISIFLILIYFTNVFCALGKNYYVVDEPKYKFRSDKSEVEMFALDHLYLDSKVAGIFNFSCENKIFKFGGLVNDYDRHDSGADNIKIKLFDVNDKRVDFLVKAFIKNNELSFDFEFSDKKTVRLIYKKLIHDLDEHSGMIFSIEKFENTSRNSNRERIGSVAIEFEDAARADRFGMKLDALISKCRD